ncbi:MAG TPA: hypothetical protein VFC07_16480, partial [Verrucomicrobiae bacterium]|nr:hypothetical protein [Verrucomicrobiae bacterium]
MKPKSHYKKPAWQTPLVGERKGLTIHEAAASMPPIVSRASYYDIELCEGDFTCCYTLNEIKRVCGQLDIHPRDLFCDVSSPATSI